ncbi:hypothetical protein GCM10010383_17450 [Streptomyces lomondensis]|uniref:Uncharacterized protein n=1 Tax=Streptomyces lomondensis TaxID=68229 RepID=A0ABQ2X066_9ACTN|nr:hypothetical protein GCM10010383_17450 [Streptomyces lomondensis]
MAGAHAQVLSAAEVSVGMRASGVTRADVGRAVGGPVPTGVRLTDEQADHVVTAIGDALDGRFLTLDELTEEVVARTGPWAGDRVMPAFQDLCGRAGGR